MTNDFTTITGRITRLTRFPHNTSHVDVETDDGLVVAELDHEAGGALRLDMTVRMRGVITIQRGVRFLIDIVEIGAE